MDKKICGSNQLDPNQLDPNQNYPLTDHITRKGFIGLCLSECGQITNAIRKQNNFCRSNTSPLSASSDATARLWSMSTGEAIRVYQGHHKATVCCALHDGAEATTA